MAVRRRILNIHPAAEGIRAMFISAVDAMKVEAIPVIVWALCEELPEIPALGVEVAGGPTVVSAMIAHVSAGSLVFADSLPRFVGIAQPHDSDADWMKLVQRAAATRAHNESRLIEQVEQAAELADRVLSTAPPALRESESEAPKR